MQKSIAIIFRFNVILHASALDIAIAIAIAMQIQAKRFFNNIFAFLSNSSNCKARVLQKTNSNTEIEA